MLDDLLPLAVDAVVEVAAPDSVELVGDVKGGEAEPQMAAVRKVLQEAQLWPRRAEQSKAFSIYRNISKQIYTYIYIYIYIYIHMCQGSGQPDPPPPQG